jgi:hypothetical protein
MTSSPIYIDQKKKKDGRTTIHDSPHLEWPCSLSLLKISKILEYYKQPKSDRDNSNYFSNLLVLISCIN